MSINMIIMWCPIFQLSLTNQNLELEKTNIYVRVEKKFHCNQTKPNKTGPHFLSRVFCFYFYFFIIQRLRLHWRHNSSVLQLSLSLHLHVHGNLKVLFFFFTFLFIISHPSLFPPTPFLPLQCSHRPNLYRSPSFLTHLGSPSPFLLRVCYKVIVFLLAPLFFFQLEYPFDLLADCHLWSSQRPSFSFPVGYLSSWISFPEGFLSDLFGGTYVCLRFLWLWSTLEHFQFLETRIVPLWRLVRLDKRDRLVILRGCFYLILKPFIIAEGFLSYFVWCNFGGYACLIRVSDFFPTWKST